MTTNGVNIANGVFSALVLICGIIYSALSGALINKALEMSGVSGMGGSAYVAYASAPIWAIGFAYIVPGLLGVIASIVRKKGMYIAEMVFAIITLVVMGIFFIVGILALIALAVVDYTQCSTTGVGECACVQASSGFSSTYGLGMVNYPYSCNEVQSMYGFSVGIIAMIVLGWIFCLVATVVCGMLACKSEHQPGVIMSPHGPMTTSVQMGHIQQGGYPQSGYPQAPPQSYAYNQQPSGGKH